MLRYTQLFVVTLVLHTACAEAFFWGLIALAGAAGGGYGVADAVSKKKNKPKEPFWLYSGKFCIRLLSSFECREVGF